jgi:hypothetical protein
MRSSSWRHIRSGSNVLISRTVTDASKDANAVVASTARGSLPHPFMLIRFTQHCEEQPVCQSGRIPRLVTRSRSRLRTLISSSRGSVGPHLTSNLSNSIHSISDRNISPEFRKTPIDSTFWPEEFDMRMVMASAEAVSPCGRGFPRADNCRGLKLIDARA